LEGENLTQVENIEVVLNMHIENLDTVYSSTVIDQVDDLIFTEEVEQQESSDSEINTSQDTGSSSITSGGSNSGGKSSGASKLNTSKMEGGMIP
jgi:hypothetical protein